MSYKYRLKKGARSFKVHEEWNICTEVQKEQIENNSPNRFDFEQQVKAEVPPAAIVKDKPKKGRPKKTEDK